MCLFIYLFIHLFTCTHMHSRYISVLPSILMWAYLNIFSYECAMCISDINHKRHTSRRGWAFISVRWIASSSGRMVAPCDVAAWALRIHIARELSVLRFHKILQFKQG